MPYVTPQCYGLYTHPSMAFLAAVCLDMTALHVGQVESDEEISDSLADRVLS